MNVYLHLGFPKTGTTSIQRLLEINRHALFPLVVKTYSEDTASVRGALRNFRENPSEATRRVAGIEISKFFRGISSSHANTTIVSDENWFGRVLYDDNGNLRTWGLDCLRLIQDVCNDDIKLNLVFTTRDHETWLTSLYAQTVKRGGEYRSKRSWCRNIPYGLTQDSLISAFATATNLPVHVFSMEDDLRLGPFLGAQLLEACGVEKSKMNTLIIPPKQNPALSQKKIAAMRLINCLPMGSRRKMRVSEWMEKKNGS